MKEERQREAKTEIIKPGETIPLTSSSGKQIGNYRLIERIGEGGMGEVYAAEQISPIQRRVALKIVKVGMDSDQFTTRFESERQALAVMDHPYIAQVFDAGTTPRGRPYFVMEYVQGIPLLEYCNQHRLDISERLDLFLKTCEGIQHAHQKAIIHRDIKPSNILVAGENGEAWPKIIDFGVAKALDRKLTEDTIQTELGQIIGTPDYMSPEQAYTTGENIDTRTDIYQLGVLLYELLTDMLPFDSEELRAKGIEALLYTIRVVEPPRPSIRLNDLGERVSQVAEVRKTTSARLISQVQGDLDWITMKAMEKDHNRRYETTNAMAMDIRRYLNDEPVLAGPPSTSYRMKKFVRRNRTGVVAASVVSAAIILGIIGTTVGMIRAQASERVAQTEAETSAQVCDFMVGLFSVSDPSEARGNTITAREILDRGVQQIQGGLQQQPMVQARLQNTMGKVYTELGLYHDARPLLESSLANMEQLEIGNQPEAAIVMDNLGRTLRRSGQYDEARQHLETAMSIREQELSADDADLAQSYNSYANLLWQTGEYEQAEEYYQRALTIRERSLAPDHPDLAVTLNNLGGLNMQTGDFMNARPYLERALAIREASLGQDHPDVASSLANLGSLFHRMGDYDTAETYHDRALVLVEKLYGPDHPRVAGRLNDYAMLVEDMGDYARAQTLYERALAIRETTLGPEHPDVAIALSNLASLHIRFGDYQTATVLLEQALKIWETTRGPDHVDVAQGENNLAIVLQSMGDYAGAQTHLVRALAINQQNYGENHPEVAQSLMNLGINHTNLGQFDLAHQYIERALSIRETAFGPDHPEVAETLRSLGNLLRDSGDYTGAQPALERCIAIQTQALGPEHPDLANSFSDLAMLFYFSGELAAAQSSFERALALQKQHLAFDNPGLVDNLYNLACLSALQGGNDQAKNYLFQALERGFANPYVAEDADLSSLHGDSEFESMVAEVMARAGQG